MSQTEFNNICPHGYPSHVIVVIAKGYVCPQKSSHLDYDIVSDKANAYFKTRGEVEIHRTGYHQHTGKLRVSIGEYGEAKRPVKLNYKPNEIAKLAVDVDFAKKVAAEITERMLANRQKYNYDIAMVDYASRKAIVYDANKAFFQSIGNHGSFELSPEGDIVVSISIKGNIDRLKEIVDFTKQPLTKVV